MNLNKLAQMNTKELRAIQEFISELLKRPFKVGDKVCNRRMRVNKGIITQLHPNAPFNIYYSVLWKETLNTSFANFDDLELDE
jgi:hypothetical protein